MLSIGLCAQAACILEVSARKPGNVHRFVDFDDLTYLDFILSAAAIAPWMDSAAKHNVGITIRQSIRATRQVVATNTNLGIVLLLAPLAAVSQEEPLRAGVKAVLGRLTQMDARRAYQAIRLAEPGGLGTVKEQDVASEPTETLREVMARAADRDLIARQYANGFQEVLNEGVPALAAGLGGALEHAIVHCHVTLMAKHPDSLIARKHGPAEAEAVRVQAASVLEQGGPFTEAGRTALADLDRWLREPGKRRNPGTTADLGVACLFAALRDGTITLPTRFSS